VSQLGNQSDGVKTGDAAVPRPVGHGHFSVGLDIAPYSSNPTADQRQ
jgi:hypothetical protein